MAWAAVAAAAVGVVGGAIANRNKGSGGSVSTAENKTALTPEQQSALQQLLGQLTGRTNATTGYGGPLSASPNTGQNKSLAALEELAMKQAGGGPGTTDEARGTLSKFMHESDDPEATNERFRHEVQDPAMQSFQKELLPMITSRFKGNAAYGSDRTMAESNALGTLGTGLAASRSKMAFDTSEAAKSRALQAAGMVPGMDASMADILFKIFGAQSGMQGVEQAGLDRNYAEFLRRQKGEETNINQILAALGLNTVNTVVTPGQPGAFTAAAGGFGNAAGQYLGKWLTTPSKTDTTGSPGLPSGLDYEGGPAYG
jgi:hypothetical protein